MAAMLTVTPIPAFEDNYIWVLADADHALAVDPGEAEPLLDHLDKHGLRLCGVLVTHHHGDHVAGNGDLLKRYPGLPIYGCRRVATVNHPLVGGERLDFPELNLRVEVIASPGHTVDHLAYYGANRLFCGDALFTCGCGKLFDGSAEQAYASLCRFAELPDDTLVCCAHEYTLANLPFARHVEPENTALAAREIRERETRRRGLPTLPATLLLEKQTNPFMRCHIDTVRAAASRHAGVPLGDGRDVFRVLREWRNLF